MSGGRDRHRIFIAVPLDPSLWGAVLDLERRLASAAPRLRWIQPGKLHFTFRFLGWISGAETRRVQDAVRAAAPRSAPFRVVLQGVGAFPSLRRPQVIWLGAGEGRENLVALAAEVGRVLTTLGFPPEDRPFVPHLTLARLNTPRPDPALVRALAGSRQIVVGTQQVDRVVVMESHLHPEGARYIPVEEVSLGEVLKSS